MRCPRCGYEVSPDEVFCGQCGAPNTPPAQATEMVSTPLPQNGLLGSYNMRRANASLTPPQTSPAQPPTYPAPGTQNLNPPSLANGAFTPNQPAGQPGFNQQTGFYNDATEAMTSFSSRPAQGYPGTPMQNAPMQGGYPASGAYPPQAQPYQSGYGNQAYPGGQSGYQYPSQFSPPPGAEKQKGNGLVIAVSLLLVVALISIVGLATLYIVRGRSAPSPTASQPSSNTASTPAVIPSPTPIIAPSPTVIPSPTPIIAPTAAADAGYTLCGPVCNNYGFSTEYPSTWQPGATPGINGIQFTNPTQQDIYANFKAPGATTSTADALVSNDLQNYFANKQNYVAPAGTSTTTISGETWVTAIAFYDNQMQSTQQNQQGQQMARERVEVYATVHQGNAYIIELQAPDTQFDTTNTQYFINMLGKFQFLAVTQ